METENKILGQGLKKPNHEGMIRLAKAAILGGLSVISFAITWWLLSTGLTGGASLSFWFWSSLSAAFGVSFLAFLTVVDVNKFLFWATNFLILVSYILFLPKAWPVMVGGLIFFLFVWLFERHIREDEHSRADFEINRILRSSINFMIYGILILIGFNLYNLLQDKLQQNPDQVYNQIGHYAAEGLQYVPSGVGDFNPNQNFDDFVAKQAQSQDPQYQSFPKPVQQQVQDQFKEQLESKFHLQVQGNPILGDVVAGAVASRVKSAASNYSRFFPIIFAAIIVILLRYTAFLFVWLTSIISWLLFRSLLMVSFFHIRKVQVEVDKLQI